MTEYKDTLNLPRTDFPMKANLAQREPKMLAQWHETKVYETIRSVRIGRERFILHDGPPYANGHLHCGHALNKILKDIIVKSKTLSGYDAPFVPGWDCHGLPVELNVEKKWGKAGVKISHEDFRVKCREYAASQIDIQRQEFQRLGVFGDWQNPYTTMDYHYEANVVRALAKIIQNGHMQQGFKPVHWCIDCGSALAEAEVEYEDKHSPSIDVAFMVINPEEILATMGSHLSSLPITVPIWTTTPWTLPANEAVCLHPKLSYLLIEAKKSYWIVAEALFETVMARYGIAEMEVRAKVAGKALEGIKLQHPFYAREVPIVLGDHVTIEAGTGCVHTAPAHGPEDYAIGQLYNLPLINPVMANGCYAADVPLFAGLSVLKANENILAILQEKNVLVHHETLSHSYPHCWRHKTPMIFRATPQWFITMDKGLRQELIEQIEAVQWLPEWGKVRIKNMVEDRPDWCISRQRAWNTPMPLFIHKTTRQLHPRTLELMEEIAKRIDLEGIEAWFKLEVSSVLGEDAEEYEKIGDALDVWFDSGVSHFCVLKQGEQLGFPADIYLEGSDQHRGWFNSSLTTAVAMYGVAPYKTVLTHGYTVDSEGRKLSKSKGNYVALDSLINQHGADILRLWVASTDYRNEAAISDEIIKRNADAYRRIRNTARFLLANLFDFDPKKHILSVNDMVALDKWAIKRCQQLQETLLTAYDQYQFHIIYQKIHNFCAVDLGSFYLDIIKDRQYTTPVNSLARRSCQTAMYHIIQALTRWLAPILSFTAEEIWQSIPYADHKSIFLECWYDAWPEIQDIDMAQWQTLQAIRDEVNKALEAQRQAGVIGSALEANVTLYVSDAHYALLQSFGNELRFILITSAATVLPLSDRSAQALWCEALGLAIEIQATVVPKCSRCWHRLPDVGLNAAHPELCLRCVDNISGQDEIRHFA